MTNLKLDNKLGKMVHKMDKTIYKMSNMPKN